MNLLPTRAELDAAATIVYGTMPATPQFSWPLLNEALCAAAWFISTGCWSASLAWQVLCRRRAATMASRSLSLRAGMA
jgi:hypothetical protein